MIVEDSNGLWTERLPNRAAELRRTQSSRGGTSTSTAQSEETRRHTQIATETATNEDAAELPEWMLTAAACGEQKVVRCSHELGRKQSGSEVVSPALCVHCCTLHCCEPSNASLLLHVTLTLSKTLPPPLCNYLCTPAPPTALWHRSPCEQYICIVIMQCILHSRCQELCQIRRHYIVRAADIDCYICHKRSLYWARKAAEAQACPSLMMVKLQTRKQLFFFIYMCLGRWL